jgi:hypothetical protein
VRKAGTEYEELVAEIAKACDPGADVRAGVWVDGPDGRLDMDVHIAAKLDGRPFNILVECKDYDRKSTGKVERALVDALDSKRADLPVDATILCSNSGFSQDALRKARRKCIGMISILKKGDARIKAEIIEERYIPRVELNRQFTTSVTGPNAIPSPFDVRKLVYASRPVFPWLEWRATLVAVGNPEKSGAVVTFRLRQPTVFDYGAHNLILKQLSIRFTYATTWHPQVVTLDASTGIYDYLRGRVRLAPGKQTFTMSQNRHPFDLAPPIPGPPPNWRKNLGLQPGEIDMHLIVVDGSPDPEKVALLDAIVFEPAVLLDPDVS